MDEGAHKWFILQGMLGELYDGSEADMGVPDDDSEEVVEPDPAHASPDIGGIPKAEGLHTAGLRPLDLDNLSPGVLLDLADALSPQPRQIAV